MAKNRKKSESIPADETKAQRFSRLATKRVSKALKAIANVGNLAGPSYEYTPEQVEKIAKLFEQSLDAAMEKFAAKGKAPEMVVQI